MFPWVLCIWDNISHIIYKKGKKLLVRVTENCDMDCNHCMVDANPDGQHMTSKTYDQTLWYVRNLGMPIIMLTGGEPTRHPEIIEMIQKARRADLNPVLLSNGTFLENDELKREIVKTGIAVQITNDPRYYPRRVPIIDSPQFSYEHKLRSLAPFHRALKNNLTITAKSPGCFNLRSLCRNFGAANSLPQVLLGLGLMGRMCTPSVNVNGEISAGESNSCEIVGHVKDDLDKIFKRLISMRCNKCGLVYNLTDDQKRAIGEKW